MIFRRFLILSALALAAFNAEAHTGLHAAEGWAMGFAHPLSGWDHLLAMFGVGLWAALDAPGRAWRLPLVFMAVMALGGAIGAAGLAVAAVEPGIAASVLVLGLLVGGKLRVGSSAATALVGLFALFHGLAHGAEIGQGTDGLAYALGFVCATGLLHGLGVVLGWRLLPLSAAYRATGWALGLAGLALLAQAV